MAEVRRIIKVFREELKAKVTGRVIHVASEVTRNYSKGSVWAEEQVAGAVDQ